MRHKTMSSAKYNSYI